jgi:hypothetical protein
MVAGAQKFYARYQWGRVQDMAETSDGKCLLCGETVSKRMIKKHLDKCRVISGECVAEDNDKSGKYYCFAVQGLHDPKYWIYMDIFVGSTLDALDGFLRDIWLECCGHLSAFEINGQYFSSSPDRSLGDKSMNIRLEKILEVGTQFKYEYDFGSTTSLKLKVVSEYYGKKRKRSVKLLARNHQPDIQCSCCGKPATNVCCECIYDDTGWLCDDCAKEHECGEEMLLPVVNSPRVGVCAYAGGSYDE